MHALPMFHFTVPICWRSIMQMESYIDYMLWKLLPQAIQSETHFTNGTTVKHWGSRYIFCIAQHYHLFVCLLAPSVTLQVHFSTVIVPGHHQSPRKMTSCLWHVMNLLTRMHKPCAGDTNSAPWLFYPLCKQSMKLTASHEHLHLAGGASLSFARMSLGAKLAFVCLWSLGLHMAYSCRHM